MSTDYEKLAEDLLNGRQNPVFAGKSEAIKNLANSSDGRKIKEMMGNGEALKKAMENGDSAALQNIVKNVLNTQEGARLAEALAKMLK